MRKILANRALKVGNTGERTASNTPSRDLCEESLDLIEPTRAGGREMQNETGMASEPVHHLRLLVRRVVVKHKMNLQVAGNLTINLAKEAQELLMAMTPMARADDFAGGDIKGRETKT